jgi:aminoglycoside 3-N-acetyltransferase
MLMNLYRKLVRHAYSKYTPIRRSNASKALEHKRSTGYNSKFKPSSVEPSELSKRFAAAGLKPNDTIFIRTSLEAANAFNGGAMSYLKELMNYFSSGTIVMSSYTFNKTPLLVLAENPLFNPNTSTDQLNLVSELFRRTPGVVRSVHPTHSLCAYGKHADWLVADHHKSDFCYGPDSPFARLYELNAKEISVGVYPTSISFHYIEQFVPETVPGYHDLTTPVMCRILLDGKEEKMPFKVTDTFARYQANYKVFDGTDAKPVKYCFSGGLDFYTLELTRQLQTMKQLVAEGKYWHIEPSRFTNLIFKNIIKPLVTTAFFTRKNNILYPVKEIRQ